MNDKELKDVLAALTESLITLTQTSYYGHEMARACYELLVKQSPDPETPAQFLRALHGVGALTTERDRLIERLRVLQQRLTTD